MLLISLLLSISSIQPFRVFRPPLKTKEFCNESSCPVMCAGSTEFIWLDSYKKSSKITARQYIDYVFSFIQVQLDDETIFPTKASAVFPKDFHSRYAPSHLSIE
jgi:hypothetical protein